MNELVLHVTGMHCGGCVASVQKVLSGLPGVADAEVSLEPAEARVRYDPEQITPAALGQAVIDVGFGVEK